jgi:hypothetical protein
MLIKLVYEARTEPGRSACTEPGRSVDPLKCPKPCPDEGCGKEMYGVSFIERHQMNVIEKILKHCSLWKDKVPRRPPPEEAAAITEEPYYDYRFLEPA